MRRSQLRRCRGAGTIDTIVGLSLIVLGTVAAVLLLGNAGMACYYKQKLALVCEQTVHFASSCPRAERELRAQSVARGLCEKLGLPVGQLKVQVVGSTITSGEVVEVSIEIGGLPLVGKGDILPTAIALCDRAAAPVQVDSRLPNLTVIGYGGMRADVTQTGSWTDKGALVPGTFAKHPNILHSGVKGPKGELALFPIVTDDGKTPVYEMEAGQIMYRIR